MAIRVAVVLGWLVTLGIAIIGGFTARGTDLKYAMMLVALFTVIILPLHLEVFFTSITWDDSNIHTRSPWRRRRIIPFSAVAGCTFSKTMQWHRIRTTQYGVIRLHSLMRGVSVLLEALPCPVDETS